MEKKVELRLYRAKEMRAAMNTAASFLDQLYELRGTYLYGDLYAFLTIERLKRLAKVLDKQIKAIEGNNSKSDSL